MDAKELKHRLIAGASVTFLGSCFTIFFALLLTIVLGGMLDIADFGLLSAVLATTTLTAGLLDVRFGEAVTKFSTDFIANGQTGKAIGLIRFSYLVELCSALIVLAILFIPAPLIAQHLLLKPKMAGFIRIAAFVSLAGCSSSTSVAVLRTFNRFTAITCALIFVGITRFLLPVAMCLLYAKDLRYILVGYVLAALVAMLALTGLAIWTVRAELPGARAESIWPDLKRIVPFTLQTLLGVVFKALSRGDMAIFIVTRYRPEEEIAYLKLGLQVAGMLAIVPSAVGFVTYPSFAELWAKGEKKLLLHVIKKLSKWLAVLLSSGSVLVLLIMPTLINIWKSGFLPAMNVMYWLVAASAVDGVCCWIRPASLSLGKPWISTLVNLVRMVALLGLGFLLVPIPQIGYVGIGIATLALAVTSMPLGAALVVKSIIKENPRHESPEKVG